jgi:hypothetical protein
VKPRFKLASTVDYRDTFDEKEVIFFGYSKGWGAIVFVHFAYKSLHIGVNVDDISSMTFVQ